MSKVLTAEEKKENQRKSEVTYKIIACSLEKLEDSRDLLCRIYGSKKVIVSSIIKNRGDSGFHCFVNVLPPKEEVQ